MESEIILNEKPQIKQSVIKLKSVDMNVYYQNYHALKGINMQFVEKTVTALIGPSGCGKSTYLRLFNRMNDLIKGVKIKGEILIGDENIYDNHVQVDELRKHVGMVFQKPNPFPKSIFENVAFGLRVNGIRSKTQIEETVEHSLKQAALWSEVKDKLKKSALKLSGGQQQRLCIARALAIKPSILLMDEPASSLDPLSTAKIEDLVKVLKQNYTIIMVTHNMQQAARVSDQTAFFYMGELIEQNGTEELFNNAQNRKTQNYIAGKFG